jgi:hypothetical protein
MPPERARPLWGRMKDALAVFRDDYAIVGHGGDPTVSPFDAPRPYGEYTLTQLPREMREAEFEFQAGSANKIVITCMDRRVARKIWEKETADGSRVLLLAVAGGVVQTAKRHEAMESVARYLARFGHLEQVVAADHEHVCGAVKTFLAQVGLVHDSGLPGLLGKAPGSPEERELMNRLIAYGACPWIRAFGTDRVAARDAYIKEAEHEITEFRIDLSQVEPLSVENLEQELIRRKRIHRPAHSSRAC